MSTSSSDSTTPDPRQGPTTIVLRGNVNTPSLYPKYAIVGAYADDETNFVRHIALLASDTELPQDEEVEVRHMGPPIIAGEESLGALTPSALNDAPFASAEIASDLDLTPEERNAAQDWLSEVDKERRPPSSRGQYVVHPHMVWKFSEQNRPMYRRFSCAGFVLECYRQANINLIETNADNFPKVELNTLEMAYHGLFAILRNLSSKAQEKLLEHVGLDGSGPWPVCLPGYLFHSLNRASKENPRPEPHLPDSSFQASFPLEVPASLQRTCRCRS